MKREIVRLDNVWGVGGGQRPVKLLIKEVLGLGLQLYCNYVGVESQHIVSFFFFSFLFNVLVLA